MEIKFVKKIFDWGLEHAPFALPVKPLRQTPHWLVFKHPVPSYPVHILLVPKKSVSDWMSLELSDEYRDLMGEFLGLTQSLVREYKLVEDGYRLILNGGKYQSFPHLHFHLVSGDAFSSQN